MAEVQGIVVTLTTITYSFRNCVLNDSVFIILSGLPWTRAGSSGEIAHNHFSYKVSMYPFWGKIPQNGWAANRKNICMLTLRLVFCQERTCLSIFRNSESGGAHHNLDSSRADRQPRQLA